MSEITKTGARQTEKEDRNQYDTSNTNKIVAKTLDKAAKTSLKRLYFLAKISIVHLF